MAKYKVIKHFTDLQDNNHAYHEGDIFPREGLDVPNSRLIELSTDKNRRKIPLIKEIPEEIPEEVIENTDIEEGISVTQEDTSKEKTASNPPKKGRAKRNAKEA